jgi:pimeloyl-ACP methyl ester carboxylesterase
LPGFGTLPRPPIAWSPDAYRSFVAFFLERFSKLIATVAAGHAAGYLVGHASDHPHSAGRQCLIAPTWRGPLPTMMGRRHPVFRTVSRLVDYPIVRTALYRLNVNRPMIRMMSLGHVYDDRSWPNGQRFAEKLQVTNAVGARHASFRFVTGELDPMMSRDEFLQVARRVKDPVLVIYGAKTPPRSKAEMQAVCELPGISCIELPRGKLGVHEEFPLEIAAAIRDYLSQAALQTEIERAPR